MKGRTWLLLLALAAGPRGVHAQDTSLWAGGVRSYVGFILPHHKGLRILQDRHAIGGELFLQRPFSGKEPWHGHFLRPAWGISAMWWRPGSDDMGPIIRMIPYLELPALVADRLEVNTRIGWGLGMVRSPYDRLHNPKQHAVGTRWNIAVQAAVVARYTFGRQAVDAGLSLDHLSNGSLQQPNLGVNIAAASVGWTYSLVTRPTRILEPDTSWRARSRTFYEVMVNGGMNEVATVGTGRRGLVSIAASMFRRVTAKSALGIGIDVFNKANAPSPSTSPDPRAVIGRTQFGLHIGYGLLLGDLMLNAEVGHYLVSPVQESASIYTRIGMRQVFCRRFFANFSLKSHFFMADHFELGIGYRLAK